VLCEFYKKEKAISYKKSLVSRKLLLSRVQFLFYYKRNFYRYYYLVLIPGIIPGTASPAFITLTRIKLRRRLMLCCWYNTLLNTEKNKEETTVIISKSSQHNINNNKK
jgi:hypothetical protein